MVLYVMLNVVSAHGTAIKFSRSMNSLIWAQLVRKGVPSKETVISSVLGNTLNVSVLVMCRTVSDAIVKVKR
jgi:hypothetical protein